MCISFFHWYAYMRTSFTTDIREEYWGCLSVPADLPLALLAWPAGHCGSPSERLHMAISHTMTRYTEASIAPPHLWLAALIGTRQNPMPTRVARSLIRDPKHAQNLQCADDVRIIVVGLYNPHFVMTYDGLIEVCGTEIITNKLSTICANTYPWIQEYFFLIKQTS